jgi:chromosome segregation ATPase
VPILTFLFERTNTTEALLSELQHLRSQMHIASANVGRMGDRMSGSIKALQEVQCVLDERTQTLTIVQARLAESEKALETLRNAMVLRDTTMSDMDHELEALKDSGGSAFLNSPHTHALARRAPFSRALQTKASPQ